MKLVQESLKNLQTDYLDMVLLHWPGVYGLPNQSKDVIILRNIAYKSLCSFKEQGLIKSVGVSNFLVRHLEQLKIDCEVIPALNQVEFHPKCYDFELLEYCKENGILLQAYSSLGTSGDNSLRHHEVVKSVAKTYYKSTSQILLNWALRRKVAIIPKASSKRHLQENIQLNFEISDDDLKRLDFMRENCDERFDWDPNDII